jgi:hypothetical protein
MEYFIQFFTPAFLSFLVAETNRYADQFLNSIARPVTKFCRFGSWKPVTVEEMRQFLGLWMLTGIIKNLC